MSWMANQLPSSAITRAVNPAEPSEMIAPVDRLIFTSFPSGEVENMLIQIPVRVPAFAKNTML